MVRGRDACWEHCVLVDATRQKVRCNYCHREFSGGVYRMKFHLAQIRNKDIVPCPQVPNIVRDHIQSILTAPKKQKISKKPKTDRASNGQANSSSSASSGLHPNHASSGPQDSLCCLKTPELLDDSQKQKQESADKKIAAFFYQNLVAFCSAKSASYREMFGAVAECEPGYKPPSYENLRSTLLEKAKVDLHDLYRKHRDSWKESGCTILCDNRAKSYAIFSVTCPKGALFLKSVNVSGHEDDSSYLFELLESVVLEVGVENVVQVITDSEPGYVYAGQHLMAKYSSLFWSPCASSCVNKMLEDIGKQERVAMVLDEANAITKFVYSHSWTSNMVRKFVGGKELTRLRINSCVSKYLCLRAVVIQKVHLIHMFANSEQLNPEAQAIKSLLFQDRFWKDANEAVRISEGLVAILRMVDGDMPAMGYIYQGFEMAKAAIKAFYKGMAEKYMPIWEIIDRRWDLHSPLRSAAAFLNPSIFYNPNVRLDPRVRNGFQEAMMKMAASEEDKIEITKEHAVYINGQGALGTEFAIMGRTLNSPGDWWAGFGYEIPSLQRVAMRILSQPCSLHWCRWNWSTFERLHTKKRRKEEVEKLNDLVFVHCNLWLQGICESKDGRCMPIVFDEIDVDSDWFTEMEPSAPTLNDALLDNLDIALQENFSIASTFSVDTSFASNSDRFE